MNANFGLIDSCEKRIRNKQERYAHVAARALDTIEAIRSNPLACDFDRTLQNCLPARRPVQNRGGVL